MPLTPRQLYRCIIVGELHGQLTQTAFHFRGADSSPASTVQAEITNLYNDFLANVVPAYKLFCNQQWTAKSLFVVQLTARPGVIIDQPLSGGGAQTGDSLPSYCAGVLSLRTGLTGRSRVGRLYIPGVSEELSSTSRLEASYLSLLQQLGAVLTNRYGASGTSTSGRFGVFSRKLGVTRVGGLVPYLDYSINGWTQVTSTIARNVVGTQRKRLLAKGQ